MFWDAILSMPYVLFFRRSIFVVWCLNFFHTICTYSYIPGRKGNFFFLLRNFSMCMLALVVRIRIANPYEFNR
jgi:hypothetical protein